MAGPQPFTNINRCAFFNQQIPGGSTITGLSSFRASEVIIVNRTGANVFLYDRGITDSNRSFILSSGESFTVRGITYTSEVSASSVPGGRLDCRAQMFSNLSQR